MASKALQTTKAPAKRATSVAFSESGVIEEASYVISSIPTVAEFTQALRGGGKLFVDEDATETGSFLAEALDRAESGADVFSAGGGLLHVKEHLGEVFTILGIDAVRNSDFEGGVGVYLIVSAIDSEGELVKLDIGQTDPMGKLLKLHELNAFPWRVTFEKSEKATKGGFFPINLVSRQALDKSGGKVDF